MTQQAQYFPLGGGLDQVSAKISMPPGAAVSGVNLEPMPYGYRRMDGFERFDGHPKPSQAGMGEDAAQAIEAARARILPVPGSGVIRGIHLFKGEVYSIRDNAQGTQGELYKATASGWERQRLGSTLFFTHGSTTILEGYHVKGATSGATATVKRVILDSGAWTSMDAAGRLILADQEGAFVSEALKAGSTHLAKIAGNSTPHQLPPGGSYHFVNYNFYGAANLQRMYGANGVGTGFEWDGRVFVPLLTGMAVDTPQHVAAHKDHLFFSFPGGSLQHSGIGNPYTWSVLSGAGEIGLGEEITGLLSSLDLLTLFGHNTISFLYGSNASNLVLKLFSKDGGAREHTVQELGSPVFMDDAGIRALAASQDYGDFRMGSKSVMIAPLLEGKKKRGVIPVASVRLKGKDQYRVFFSDGSALLMSVGTGKPQFMPMDYGRRVCCTGSGEDTAGDEAAFFGSDDGFVYQMDRGTSFDGAPLEAFIRLPYNHLGAAAHIKRWHKIALELDAAPQTTLKMVADFDYSNPDISIVQEQDFVVQGGGGWWGEADWNDFHWSSPTSGVAEARISGRGKNISVVIASRAIHEKPFILHGLTLHYSLRRMSR